MSIFDMLLANQSELLGLSSVALMMAISPGADFVLVTRNSLAYSRNVGLYTTLGITIGTWIHIAYCIAGLAVVIKTSPSLFSIIKYIGALYLIYIGISSLKSRTMVANHQQTGIARMKPAAALVGGFISNALNPKTTLFFLGIFTQLVAIDTPVSMQLIYGSIISLAHLLWFSLLSYLLTHQKLLPRVQRYQLIINRLLGMALIALGLKLFFY